MYMYIITTDMYIVKKESTWLNSPHKQQEVLVLKERERGHTLQVVNEHETERVTGDGGFAGIIDVMETGPLLNVQN